MVQPDPNLFPFGQSTQPLPDPAAGLPVLNDPFRRQLLPGVHPKPEKLLPACVAVCSPGNRTDGEVISQAEDLLPFPSPVFQQAAHRPIETQLHHLDRLLFSHCITSGQAVQIQPEENRFDFSVKIYYDKECE